MEQEDFVEKKIMIVEDNPVNQKVMQKLIKVFGHEFLSLTDGHKVIENVKEYKPDLILMDIQLVEISGLDLTKEIKDDNELKHIPVIVVTAFATNDDKKKIIEESNCNDYLAKPFLPNELSDKIAQFIKVKDFDWS